MEIKSESQTAGCRNSNDSKHLPSQNPFSAVADDPGRILLDWRLVIAYLSIGLVALFLF